MITVAGLTPALDLTYLVEELTLGEIHRPVQVVRCAGGKSLNLARAAARLGAEVEVIAVFGGLTGVEVEQRLQSDGVAVIAIRTHTETRTCVSIADASTSRLTELYPPADPIDRPGWQAFHDQLRLTLSRRPGWLAITGSVPRGLAPTALAELIRTARTLGVRVAVDTHGPALAAAVAERPDLIKINRAEAAELLGVEIEGDLLDRAEVVKQRTQGMVIITDGEHGSVALDHHDRFRIPSPTTPGRFPVGSGDSFLGGLLSVLDHSNDLALAMRLAAGAGTANAQTPGPALFDPELARTIASTLVPTRD